MDDIAEALADGASTARLRALLDAEMAHGRQELAQKRSGYERPVLVAIAPIVGTARVMAAAGNIATALGIAIAVADTEFGSQG